MARCRCILILLALISAPLPARTAEPTYDRAKDVKLILDWLYGDRREAFDASFGDSKLLAERKDVVFYSDVAGVKPRREVRTVPCDFFESRWQAIQHGHTLGPAISITTTSLEDAERPHAEKSAKGQRNVRYYYVEAAFGNLGSHWIKLGLGESDGRTVAFVLSQAVS